MIVPKHNKILTPSSPFQMPYRDRVPQRHSEFQQEVLVILWIAFPGQANSFQSSQQASPSESQPGRPVSRPPGQSASQPSIQPAFLFLCFSSLLFSVSREIFCSALGDFFFLFLSVLYFFFLFLLVVKKNVTSPPVFAIFFLSVSVCFCQS